MIEKSAKRLLNLNEACELLNFKKSRLYYLVFKKEIPYLKIGASLRFDPDRLEKWLEASEVSPKGGAL